MSVSADALRLHLDYTAWASNKLLAEVTNLSPEELTRDFKTSDKNVLDTLVHVFAADRIWFERIHGTSPTTFINEQDRQLGTLQREWPILQQRWKHFATPLTDQGAAAKVSYRDIKGNPYEQPLWQILLHVVNHGTHHRGQASGFLRAMGHPPPQLDLIAYYRQLAAL